MAGKIEGFLRLLITRDGDLTVTEAPEAPEAPEGIAETGSRGGGGHDTEEVQQKRTDWSSIALSTWLAAYEATLQPQKAAHGVDDREDEDGGSKFKWTYIYALCMLCEWSIGK
ncbi:uncharacterized protein RAG0_13530 [Rhynchosporium agropyri]|uniref:Uncharacterized protein n=1 Tax=Rhynchosporium agropyri TaxID=914238 RepID=A0A1E1LDF1_9HELO|nr:uncharacterized protein RAG0_13530 [Rhynchosporium agropyri]